MVRGGAQLEASVGYLIVTAGVCYRRRWSRSFLQNVNSKPTACDEANRRIRLLLLLILPLVTLQFGCTLPLWLGQSDFPQVALFGAPRLPLHFETGLLGLLFAAVSSTWLATALGRQSIQRAGLLVAACALVLLMVLNQHRLQPWAILFGWLAIVVASASGHRRWSLLQWLLIGVYVHSSISKFDYQFLHTTGQQFLGTLCDFFGWDWSAIPRRFRLFAAGAFPFVELLIGVGLMRPVTRRFAVGCGIVMHVVLMLVLGPWGLNHLPAVLIWNGQFLVFLLVLFGHLRTNQNEQQSASSGQRDARKHDKGWASAWIATVAVLLATFVPLLEPWGMCDHWPAWGLYAPRNSRVAVFIAEEALERLPESVSRHLAVPKFNDPEFPQPVRYLNLAAWSLAELRAPIYPQDRFQLAVALGLGEQFALGDAVYVQRQSRSARIDGSRESSVLLGMAELNSYARRFRMNALPRPRIR